MDSLSQAALGSVIAVAVTGGKHPGRAIAFGAVIGTLPDLDVFQRYDNDLQGMINHRSWSHSFLTHLVLGPLLGLLLARIDKSWSRLRWVALVVAIWITHALLDGFTIYGTWLFWPFASQPVMGGSIFIIDPLYTLPLVIALVMTWRGTNSSQSMRRALGGLAISTLYLGWGLYAKAHIEQIAGEALARQGLESHAITATPTPFNSILWRVIAMDKEVYHEGYFGFLDAGKRIDFDSIPRHPELAAKIPGHVDFPGFANFNHGYYKLEEDDGKVIASDLRMGLEPYFKFRFVMKDTQSGAKVPRAAPENIDTAGVLRWTFDRITCPALGPVYSRTGHGGCSSDAPAVAQ